MRPVPLGRMLACAVLALLVIVAAERLAALPRAGRIAGRLLIALAFGAAVLLVAGVRLRLLAPAHWGDLRSGIGEGLDAMPNIGVPYRGVDPWVLIDLIVDGALLFGLAAVLMLRARRLEHRPLGAALVLATTFIVPVAEHNPPNAWLWGAVFSLLFGALLWADRVERAYLPGVAVFITVAVGAGLFAAPRLDTDKPWLNYQAIIESLTGTQGVRFSWEHGYGPLHWPRTNKEMLRVAAKTPSYWKAVDLDDFDGLRWRTGHITPGMSTEIAPNHADWKQRLRFTIRGLRSNLYIAAGTGTAIEHSPRFALPSEPGTFVTGSKPLQKGDSYVAEVYSPHPSIRELRNAGTDYPGFVDDYLTMDLPPSVGGPPAIRGAPSSLPPTRIQFGRFSTLSIRTPPMAFEQNGAINQDGGGLLIDSQYAEMYDLAQRMRTQAFTPYDYLLAIERRLSTGYAYSENPPKPAPGRPPLVSFLFDTKKGYCQHYSGVMALLLRMGGVPARVGSGFSPGTYDRARGEWVVRDVDAHSWVEAYFPKIGWVTFDPTPGVAPPRTQLLNEPAPPNAREIPLRSDPRRADVPKRPGADGGGGVGQGETVSIWLILVLGLLAGAIVGGVGMTLRAWRRPEKAPPQLAEPVRALRPPGPPIQPPAPRQT